MVSPHGPARQMTIKHVDKFSMTKIRKAGLKHLHSAA